MKDEKSSISANMGNPRGRPRKNPSNMEIERPIPSNPNKANHIVKGKNKNG